MVRRRQSANTVTNGRRPLVKVEHVMTPVADKRPEIVIRKLEEMLTKMTDTSSSAVIPGLPRYLTRRTLLNACRYSASLLGLGAVALHQNPVVMLKAVMQAIRPDLLIRLRAHVRHFTAPSLLQTAIKLGMIWPTAGLKLAEAYVTLRGKGIDSKVHTLLADMDRLGLDNAQLRTLYHSARVIFKYLPYMASNNMSARPSNNGMDLLPAFQAILTALDEAQVQKVCGMLLVLLAVHQPETQNWFSGLDVPSLMRYLCGQGLRLENAMCSSNSRHNNLLTALKVANKRNAAVRINQRVF